MAELLIRDMQFSDVAAVMATEGSAYSFPWSEGVMHDCLHGPYTCEVVSDNGELVAHMISHNVAGELHLLNICVAKHQQRKGIGLLLLQHLLETGSQQRVDTVFLEVRKSNTAALKLYKDNGFEVIGERRDYYRNANDREDAIVMAIASSNRS